MRFLIQLEFHAAAVVPTLPPTSLSRPHSKLLVKTVFNYCCVCFVVVVIIFYGGAFPYETSTAFVLAVSSSSGLMVSGSRGRDVL